MSGPRPRGRILAFALAGGVLALALTRALVLGLWVSDAPFVPADPAEGARCELVRWPGPPEGPAVVRCAAVFDRPVEPLWRALTDYAGLGRAFDSALYSVQVEAVDGAAPAPVALRGAVAFGLARFPLDLLAEHEVGAARRVVRWQSDTPSLVARGRWALEPLGAQRTRVEYLLDARVRWLPDFVVRTFVRDNAPRLLLALRDAAPEAGGGPP